jgi:hypothetical protein
MTTRDQAEAGADDPTAEAEVRAHQGHTKTDQLDDAYRSRITATGSDRNARPRLRASSQMTGREALPLDDQRRMAEATLDVARVELKAATATVIDRIKAGENLPKRELDREWNARLQLMEARQLVERLNRLRKAFAPE